MILPACGMSKLPRHAKRKLLNGNLSSGDKETDFFDDTVDPDDNDSEYDMSEKEEEEENKIKILKRTWKFLSPPNEESEIIGKWFACIYATKRYFLWQKLAKDF